MIPTIPESYIEEIENGIRIWRWSVSSNSYVPEDLTWRQIITKLSSAVRRKKSTSLKKRGELPSVH